jgi:hypothetical protein
MIAKQRLVKLICFVSCLVAMLAFVVFCWLDPIRGIEWLGQRDLEIEFEVRDADSGLPVRDAEVRIITSQDTWIRGARFAPFALMTNEDGIGTKFCPEMPCSGYAPRFGVGTWHMPCPNWLVHVSARGYEASEPTWIGTADNSRRISKGEAFATLRIPFVLKKRPERVKG